VGRLTSVLSERSRAGALPPVCILAGGLGTRLGERVADTPKPLLEIAGEPFLVHQLRLLAAHGVSDVILCVGYLGDRIQERIGSEQFGIAVRYSFDGPRLDGTLGAIRRALPILGERFMVLYGDTYLRIDYAAVARLWYHSNLPAVMAVLRNQGRWEKSNAVFLNGLVTRYDKLRPTPEMEWIDYGLGGLTANAVSLVSDDESDLATLYRELAAHGQLCGYRATARFYEIGTPVGMQEADAYLRAATKGRFHS